MPNATLLACAAALLATLPSAASALDERRDDVQDFIRQMSDRHGFAPAALDQLFAQVESRPAIVTVMSRPAEKSRPWHEYRDIFLTERRITRGVETARRQAGPLQQAAERGIPESLPSCL